MCFFGLLIGAMVVTAADGGGRSRGILALLGDAETAMSPTLRCKCPFFAAKFSSQAVRPSPAAHVFRPAVDFRAQNYRIRFDFAI